MNNFSYGHTFHIPVMGIGYTIDTPVKVAQYGISSVISLVDDILMEKMREFYCKNFDIPFKEISNKIEDFRAKRITEYLNVVDKIVKEKFEKLKNSVLEKGSELEKYIEMLPDISILKKKFQIALQNNTSIEDLKNWFHSNLYAGSVDVNIMTKLDKENYSKNEKLPIEYNDAHAALRGYANSNLNSSVVLSAGMSPRLYSYFEKFKDFYPDTEGKISKKIILKVSDYRSALIQGKFLAKKGLWVSEYRVESGLNCGGHAFATEGYLMGPILEEFKQKRNELIESVFPIYIQALVSKNHMQPDLPPETKFTAQGGVGTSKEHQFLIEYYSLDSVGWGTPFLLVPEVTNVDSHTLELLCEAKENDLYLSDISPMGVPFNSLRGNTKDIEKQQLIEKGRPGSSCPKKYISINKEFTEEAICMASRQYQDLKIKELAAKELSEEKYKSEFEKIVEKSCICVGLGTATLLNNGLDTKTEGGGVSICPGPNMAYFSKVVSLKDMVDHIYGRKNIIQRNDRPNMFIKELNLYIDYFKKMINNSPLASLNGKASYFLNFQKNILDGINYYKKLFSTTDVENEKMKNEIKTELEHFETELTNIFKINNETTVNTVIE